MLLCCTKQYIYLHCLYFRWIKCMHFISNQSIQLMKERWVSMVIKNKDNIEVTITTHL